MPRTRKSTESFDCNTDKGKKRISAIKNRGADRAVDYLKKNSSKHIVLVNLIQYQYGPLENLECGIVIQLKVSHH